MWYNIIIQIKDGDPKTQKEIKMKLTQIIEKIDAGTICLHDDIDDFMTETEIDALVNPRDTITFDDAIREEILNSDLSITAHTMDGWDQDILVGYDKDNEPIIETKHHAPDPSLIDWYEPSAAALMLGISEEHLQKLLRIIDNENVYDFLVLWHEELFAIHSPE